MTAEEQAQRIAEIVEAALEHEPAELPSFLDDACGNDVTLRKEVVALLGFRKEATDFIEIPAYQSNAAIVVDENGPRRIGEVIEQYQILSLLGEGGMGEVYLAEDVALGRKVAIKLVKAGFGRASLIRHFQREERILATLTHPNIARLYGGAVTPDGVPYFVMEYVEGERLEAYCDRRQLNLQDRLQLFRKICSAVAYAHQHLVIHRDLKPSNIRVTKEGEPKLLDFGIAKLLEGENTLLTEQTITLAGVMTPDYASPEQIQGEPMTTSSDVYSLGVVLYELVTGTKPYRTKSRRLDEISRAITEQEPTRPSTAVANNPKSTSQNPKRLRGDLDNIVLRAMRKEPARRYASVTQFSEDIRRHLEGLPIIARKDTLAYRASKFVARNRIAVAAALVVAVAVISGLIVALWEAENARRQRDVAERERIKAQRINTFLQEMLGAAAPEVKGIDIKVTDVLSEASRRARAEMIQQPGDMAEVLLTLGRTYISLGLFEPAVADLRAALEGSLKANGELNLTTAQTMGWLGLALYYRDHTAEGESISRRAVELHRKLSPEGSGDLGIALYSWGMNLISTGNPKAAEPLLKESTQLIKIHFGGNHGYYLASLGALGMAREKMGNRDGAETLYRQAVEVGRGVEPRYRIFLAQALANLGILLTSKGAYSEAEDALRQCETLYREIEGEFGYSMAALPVYLGNVYFRKGDYPRAETEYRKAIGLLPKYVPPEHALMVTTIGSLGLTLTRFGKAAEGEPYLREALASCEKLQPRNDVMIAQASSGLGECLTAQKRYPEAEPLLIESYNQLKLKLSDQNSRVIDARERLVKLYTGWNKPQQAAQFR